MQIDGIIIFDSNSGVPLFSKLDESIKGALFSAFITAVRKFFSLLSLGGLSSFTTEEKFIFLAATNKIVTAVITPLKQDSKEIYSLAYEICEKFEKKFMTTDSQRLQDYSSFSDILDQLLQKNRSILPRLQDKAVFLYTVNQDGELITLNFDNLTNLSSYPVLIIVNTLIKQIFILENQEDVPNRLLFLANRNISGLNRELWKSEFQIRGISDTIDCERLIEQATNLIREIEY